MEVNKFTDILGKVVDNDIYEGRMVYLTAVADTVGLPTSAAQAALARYLVAHPVDNFPYPKMMTLPTYSFALRSGGFDQAANVPWQTYVKLHDPSLSDEPEVIPSGTGARVYDEGEFTVTSGNWVYSAGTAVGDELEVVYSAGATQGMLQKKSGGTAVAICTALPAGQKLQFRTYGD